MSTEFQGENDQIEQGQVDGGGAEGGQPEQLQDQAPEQGGGSESSASPQEHQPSPEDEARRYGWTPQEEWAGRPDQWVDASEFLDRREGTRRLNKDLSRKVEDLERTLEQRVEERLNGVRDMLKAGLDRREAEAKRTRERAFRGQDQEEWDAAEKELEAIRNERENLQQPPQQPQRQQFDPEVESFLNRNASWWNQDNPLSQAATAYAVDMAKRLKSQGVPDSAHPAIIENDMQKLFPSLQIGGGQRQGQPPAPRQQENRQQQPRQSVDNGEGSQARRLLGGRREANFSNLPPEAQRQFQEGVSAGLFKDTPEDRRFAAEAYMKSQSGNRN